MMKQDEDLVAEAQGAPSGDTRAFDQLVLRHQERVLANCRYLSGSTEDAQDLAQGVFVKAYFGLKRFQGRSAFGTWVQRIKINHCLNFIRSKKSKYKVDIEDPAVAGESELRMDPEVERNLSRADDRERIRIVLDSLPETLRLPLIMRDLDEMTYQEIADALGIGLSAVKMRIKRGRETFRHRFDRATPRTEEAMPL